MGVGEARHTHGGVNRKTPPDLVDATVRFAPVILLGSPRIVIHDAFMTHALRNGSLLLLLLIPAWSAPIPLRVVAANLTSDKSSAYSPTNGNHSNPEGAGARILQALKPDLVLIQEFNTTVPPDQWVRASFGAGFSHFREQGVQIPNGIISRHPILQSGVWDDPVLDNREFVWARIGLPGGRDLWVVSVHLHTRSAESREKQIRALTRHLRATLPDNAMLIIGGDFNTRQEGEPCLRLLSSHVTIPERLPVDDFGNPATNAPRNRVYDRVLACRKLQHFAVPVALAGLTFPDGLVFDTRVFRALDQCPPSKRADSAAPMMQHMAVVCDFLLTDAIPARTGSKVE